MCRSENARVVFGYGDSGCVRAIYCESVRRIDKGAADARCRKRDGRAAILWSREDQEAEVAGSLGNSLAHTRFGQICRAAGLL